MPVRLAAHLRSDSGRSGPPIIVSVTEQCRETNVATDRFPLGDSREESFERLSFLLVWPLPCNAVLRPSTPRTRRIERHLTDERLGRDVNKITCGNWTKSFAHGKMKERSNVHATVDTLGNLLALSVTASYKSPSSIFHRQQKLEFQSRDAVAGVGGCALRSPCPKQPPALRRGCPIGGNSANCLDRRFHSTQFSWFHSANAERSDSSLFAAGLT